MHPARESTTCARAHEGGTAKHESVRRLLHTATIWLQPSAPFASSEVL